MTGRGASRRVVELVQDEFRAALDELDVHVLVPEDTGAVLVGGADEPMTPSTSLPSMMGVLMERVSRQRSRPGQRVQMKCSRGVSMTNERRMRMTWR